MVGIEAYAERYPRFADAVIVMALLGGVVLGATLVGPGDDRPRFFGAAVTVGVVGCLAVFGARTHPRTAVVVATAAATVTGVLGFILSPMLIAPLMVALYWLAATMDTGTTWTFGSVAAVLVVGAAIGGELDAMVVLAAAGPALWLLLPLVMGSRIRLRRALLDAVAARAEHAERTREEEARLRVAEERMRIARDLHDVVAHHMAVANAQVGTAAHVLAADPELARRILAELQVTTSAAMLELRDTVRVLRRADAGPESLEPAPGLAQLPDLLTTCGSAGLTVDVETRGERRPLPEGIDLTAYRIIQEALTNAAKYAAPATASLGLDYGTTSLTITVTNARRPGRRGTGGFGLLGMRERAHAVRGSLRVTDGDEDVFEVVTTLPLHPYPATLPTGTTP